MTAPSAAKGTPMDPEKLERELLARLGLDASAGREDVAAAHEAVTAYLAAAPKGLRGWARTQAAGADEAYALLTDPAALARAVALVGAGARPAVRPGGPATPPVHRDTPAPAAAAVVPTAAAAVPAGPAPSAPAVDENGRRIVTDDEIDALLAEVDPGAHREIVGTPAQRAAAEQRRADVVPASAPQPGILDRLSGSRTARNLALVGTTVAAIAIVAVVGFNLGAPGGGIAATVTPAPAPASAAPVLDQAAVADLMAKIQANPDDADALMSLGDQYYKTGDYRTAAEWFRKVTEVEPTVVRGFLALGAASFNQGDLDAAEVAWKGAARRSTTRTSRPTTTSASCTSIASPPTWTRCSLHWSRVVELAPDSEIAKTVSAHLDAFASFSPAPAGSAAPAVLGGAQPRTGSVGDAGGHPRPDREPGAVSLDAGLGIGIAVAFARGRVSFASPCCLPLVPAYLGYMVGTTENADRRRSLFHGLAFVAGFTLVFVAFWASLGAIGYVLADNARYLRIVGGVILVVMGLQVAGVINVQALWRDTRPLPAMGGGSAGGGTIALGGTGAGLRDSRLRPLDPPRRRLRRRLEPVHRPDPGRDHRPRRRPRPASPPGTVLLLAYAAGLAVPFLAVAMGATWVAHRLGWVGRHHHAVSLVSGAMLVVLGVLMITNTLARLAAFPTPFGG